ncbi:MAG: MFS transporter [Pseudomonadota bacterium]
MSQTPLPRLPLTVLSACYFSLAVGGLAVIGLLLPMREGLGVSSSEVAFLLAVFSITYAVAAPLLQVAVGDWDRRRLLVIGLGIISAGALLTGVAQNYSTALIARMMVGVGAGLVGPMASAAGAALVPESRRGAALGYVLAGMTLATVFGVPMAAWLGDLVGWRAAFFIIGTFIALNAAAVWVFVPAHPPGERASLRAIADVLTDRVLAPAVSVTCWQMAGQFTTYSVIAVYMTERFGLPPAWLPVVLAAFGIGGVLGNFLAARFVDQLGTDRVITLSLLGTLASVIGLQLSGGILWLGLLLGFIWPVTALALFAPQQERLIALRPQAANLLLALNGAAIYLGLGAGSALAGVMLQSSGTDWLAAASSALLLCALFAYWLSRR